jgi:hypothetical protein
MKKKELVSLEERIWISKNAYRLMGKAVQIKVIDLDKMVERMKQQRKENKLSPYVEIQPISEDMHKTPNRIATYQKDPITGVHYGIAIDQDDFGNPRWQKIQIQDSLSLNLDVDSEAKIWAVIRFHPDIEGSPWQVQNPYYKIYDPIAIADRESMEIEAIKLAFDRVDMIADKPQEMVLFARYLGEEFLENANYKLVKGALLRTAKNNPSFFNQKWTDRNRSYGEYLQTALALGIIVNDISRGFLFRNIQIGLSKEDAIRTLSMDQNILSSIGAEIFEKDKVMATVKNDLSLEEKKTKTKKESKAKEEVSPPEATDFD